MKKLTSPLTYSPSMTVPLTHDCPWHCRYCGYRADKSGLISAEEMERRFVVARAQKATEILFMSGEMPDTLPHLQTELAQRGYRNFLEFTKAMCARAIALGFYPHTNIGALSEEQMRELRSVNVSMGLMLENVDEAFNQTVAPEKSLAGRLRTIAAAGRARIPYTSGILIGLGETRAARFDSLRVLADLHRRHGHLQEIILQNYVPNQGSRWPASAVTLDDYLELIALWREIAPDVAVQIPPNLNPFWADLLPFIDDLGGISDDGDLINPQNPWAQLEKYRQAARQTGRELVERWPVYEKFIDATWLDRSLLAKIRPGRVKKKSIWDWPTEELVAAATVLNEGLHGGHVTYVVNRNANFTNVCHVGCSFCGFQRRASAPDAYTRSPHEIIARLAQSPEITEVCMQGGINPALGVDYYLELVGAIKTWRPDLHIHAFSPMEIASLHKKSGWSYEKILSELRAAGLDTIPGTAAEILIDEVRQEIASRKLGATSWQEIIRTAHRVGLRSTATVMYGHVETWAHVRRHLEILKQIQEETGGFTEFIPLQFVPHENPLGHRIRPDAAETQRKGERLYPLARLFFGAALPHLQTSWVKLGVAGAAQRLDVCDDFGGTLFEESITRSSGGPHGEYLAATEIERAIRAVGKIPRQRTTLYGRIAPCPTPAGAA